MFKPLVALVVAVSAAAVVPVTSSAVAATAPRMAIAPADLGTSSSTAAGSCWEIKQKRPTATDGSYWLLTPSMSEPQQFYCDMTTNGGGWVLIGKGRDGWTKNVEPLGSASNLLSATPNTTTTDRFDAGTVDGLLNDGRVDQLADGVRLVRATNTAGTSWQESRMKFNGKFNHWAWALGAVYPLSTWSFGNTNGSGGISQNFGRDQSLNRVYSIATAKTGWRLGFAFGSNVTGSSAAATYLWSPSGQSGNALPYTLVYLRPHVSSDDSGFKAVSDAGTLGSAQQSVAQSAALSTPWGVSGLAGRTSVEGDVEVQAFTQSGDTMYVGGNFKYVQQDANGTGRVQQSFLAAFNVNTGQWVSGFRPQLNEQVKALATLPNGDVVAGGEFTQANGQPVTDIVALDPSSGATDPEWGLTIQNRKTAGVVSIHSLDVSDGYLYLAGSFTHLIGRSTPEVYASNLGRVAVATGTPSTNWNGDVDGTVNSVSGAASTVYAAGFFGNHGTTIGSTPQPALRAIALGVGDGAPMTQGWNPVWSNSANNYQRSIDTAGNKVWVGGSEHSLFQFDPTTFTRTMGDIMLDKGDIQTISNDRGVVYSGCHCNYYDYANAYAWPNLTPDWTRADGMNWIGAWDASSGSRLPQFAPELVMRTGSGIWASIADTNGTLWIGGDLTNAATATRRGAWSGGFARFPLNDSTAPSTPNGFSVTAQTATTLTLSWNAVTDPSGVHYQILRGDRPIATSTSTSVTVPKGDSTRYFLRAQDGAGNLSASSSVLDAAIVPVTTEVVPDNASWSWRYDPGAATAEWNAPGFDYSTWSVGAAPLGFGSGTVTTNIDHFAQTSDRPLTAYFAHQFDVADESKVTKLVLNSVADDGVVIYVNGTEVARSRIAAGTVTYQTYASAAVRTTNAGQLEVTVPTNLLVNGTNVVAAETHLNYRNTPDATFHLQALLTE